MKIYQNYLILKAIKDNYNLNDKEKKLFLDEFENILDYNLSNINNQLKNFISIENEDESVLEINDTCEFSGSDILKERGDLNIFTYELDKNNSNLR